MKMKNKIVTFVVMLAMIAVSFPTYKVSAADVPIIVNNVSGKPGEEVTVTVSVGENGNCSALEFLLHYNTDKIEYVSHTLGGTDYREFLEEYEGIFSTYHDEEKHTVKLAAAVSGEMKDKGTLLFVTFRIKEDAVGTSELTLTDLLLQDGDYQDIPCKGVNGIITIEKSDGSKTETTTAAPSSTTEAIQESDLTQTTAEEPSTSATVSKPEKEKSTSSMKEKDTLNTVLDIVKEEKSQSASGSKQELEKAIKNAEKINKEENITQDKIYQTVAELAVAKLNSVSNRKNSNAIVKAPFYIAAEHVPIIKVRGLTQGTQSSFSVRVPEQYKDYKISYETTDSSIFSIEEDGTVTGLKVGGAIAKVTIRIGGISRTEEVIIVVEKSGV